MSASRATSPHSARLLAWYQQHGRHDLPWQGTQDPYRVWLSEVMLQQTQVATVIPYYQRFLARFASLDALAAAPVEEVMALWSGLGYYARARNLHASARRIMQEHAGRFPADVAAILALPGIGRSTAHAIAVHCFGARLPILDGNVKRILARSHAISGWPGQAAVEQQLWAIAHDLLPQQVADMPAHIQAQMDLGATLCTRSRPDCPRCPWQTLCLARRQGLVSELPTPRPQKTLPQRALRVLLLTDGQRWLLERRPPLGIWGGLLSLPELPPTVLPQLHAAEQLGCLTDEFSMLDIEPHSLSHFHLQLQPLLAQVRQLPRVAEPGRHVWLTTEELADAALPAPIRRIFQRLVQLPG